MKLESDVFGNVDGQIQTLTLNSKMYDLLNRYELQYDSNPILQSGKPANNLAVLFGLKIDRGDSLCSSAEFMVKMDDVYYYVVLKDNSWECAIVTSEDSANAIVNAALRIKNGLFYADQ